MQIESGEIGHKDQSWIENVNEKHMKRRQLRKEGRNGEGWSNPNAMNGRENNKFHSSLKSLIPYRLNIGS